MTADLVLRRVDTVSAAGCKVGLAKALMTASQGLRRVGIVSAGI